MVNTLTFKTGRLTRRWDNLSHAKRKALRDVWKGTVLVIKPDGMFQGRKFVVPFVQTYLFDIQEVQKHLADQIFYENLNNNPLH